MHIRTVPLAVLIAATACASVERSTPVPGDRPAEISATPEDEFIWRDRTYSVDRMGDAIRTAKHSEGITAVVLRYDQDATVQDIIDVALIARTANLPAFYQQDGELKHIDVRR